MINNIKMGIKISTKNFNLVPEIYSNLDVIDYIEIILMPDFSDGDIEKIRNLKLPIVIHIPNSSYEIDFGDKTKINENNKYIKKLNRYEKKLNPFCYIVHPESGDLRLSIENIKKLKVTPIAIENMPQRSIFGGELLGYDINSLMEYFKEIPNLEFCFDINHAIKSAISKKIDYIKHVEEFLSFKKPRIFHLAGGSLKKEEDEHLHLFESEYDITKIKKLLLNLDYIVNLTFETPRNYDKKIEDDLKNMRFFINV